MSWSGLVLATCAASGDASSWMSDAQILLVDDDPGLRVLMADYLGSHGYAVRQADGVAMMRAALAEAPVDCIILDIMMPGDDGLSGLRELHEVSSAPVIMLSTLASDVDRIVGLEMGADDYIAKPCNPRELLARVRAVLRRQGRQGGVDGPGAGPIWMLDSQLWRLTSPTGELADLSMAELRLIAALVQASGRILSRNQLIEASGTGHEPFDRAVDVALSRIRRKLAPLGGDNLIRTVRGEGYAIGQTVKHV